MKKMSSTIVGHAPTEPALFLQDVAQDLQNRQSIAGIEAKKHPHEARQTLSLLQTRFLARGQVHATGILLYAHRRHLAVNAFDDDREKSLTVGMNAHRSKPIDPQSMYQTIQEHMQKRTQ